MHKICERIEMMLEGELRRISEHRELNDKMLEDVWKLTDAINNIHEIFDYELRKDYIIDEAGGETRGYSTRPYYYIERGDNKKPYYEEGNSYGRTPHMSYDRYGMRDHSNVFYDDRYNKTWDDRNYSRDEATDRMVSEMESMMRSARDSKEREIIKKCIDELKRV